MLFVVAAAFAVVMGFDPAHQDCAFVAEPEGLVPVCPHLAIAGMVNANRQEHLAAVTLVGCYAVSLSAAPAIPALAAWKATPCALPAADTVVALRHRAGHSGNFSGAAVTAVLPGDNDRLSIAVGRLGAERALETNAGSSGPIRCAGAPSHSPNARPSAAARPAAIRENTRVAAGSR